MNKYDHGPLSVADAVDLGRILQACQRGDRVRWANVHGDVLDGVARCVGDENGNRLNADEDVRDAFLRISSTFEHFIPVPTAVELSRTGMLVFDAD